MKSTSTCFFGYNIALYVTNDNEDHEFQSIKDKIFADGKRQFQ